MTNIHVSYPPFLYCKVRALAGPQSSLYHIIAGDAPPGASESASDNDSDSSRVDGTDEGSALSAHAVSLLHTLDCRISREQQKREQQGAPFTPQWRSSCNPPSGQILDGAEHLTSLEDAGAGHGALGLDALVAARGAVVLRLAAGSPALLHSYLSVSPSSSRYHPS
jgi:hypothetical protein